MEMTLPCGARHLVRSRYKQFARKPSRLYLFHERHELPVRESYAKHIAERRRERFNSEAFSRLWDKARGLAASTVVADDAPLKERLREQAEKWERETAHLSSPAQRAMHPSYQAILGMAQEHRRDVIRFLLHDLQENRREWFWALSYLAQTNPMRDTSAGKIDKMIDDWVEWGRQQRLF